MEFIISITAGLIVGFISYKIGNFLMPGSGKNEVECRRKHLRHGIETGIPVAVFVFYILTTGS